MGDVRFTESANTPCDDGEVSRSPPRSTAVIGVAQRVHPDVYIPKWNTLSARRLQRLLLCSPSRFPVCLS